MNVQLRDLSAHDLMSFVSAESFWVPDQIVDSAWIEHAPFGFWLMDALRPRMIVELGVHRGFSYFVFCQAVRRLQLQARCFAIDSFEGDEHAGFYGNDVYEDVVRRNRRYDGFSQVIRSTFAEACDQFADGSIDVLHIDGCHTRDAVRRDFETWLPKLSSRGVVLFHDTAERSPGFGVHLLWDELRARYPHFEFMHGHGLGIIGVGDNIPVKVRRLFATSASAASAQAVRAAYERLGGATDDLRQAREEKRQLAEMQARIQGYERSTSWRLTAPLRAAGTLLKSARRTGAWIGIVLSALGHAVAGARAYHAERCPRCIR
ncbi:MAG: class I SAM-dependent methyltransferase [Rhizomicrobium sp.]